MEELSFAPPNNIQDLYEQFKIIGDRAEFEKIITSCGYINIDYRDVISYLSKGPANYVVTGYGDVIAEALESAVGKLPFSATETASLLIQIFIPEGRPTQMEEMRRMTELINKMSPSVEVCFGVARDKALNDKTKVILVANESERADIGVYAMKMSKKFCKLNGIL